MKRLVIIAALLLAGCDTPDVITRDKPVEVRVPVAQECAGERPVAPTPLKDKTPNWDESDVRQKAAHVAKQGLEWQTYGEQLHAATAACP